MTDTDDAIGVVTFAEGLPGFEGTREFIIVASTALDPFTLLQGVGDGAPSFVAIDPVRVDTGYRMVLDEVDLQRLSATSDTALVWLALVAPQADASATVNLRAPIAINPTSMRGIQVLCAESAYRLDHNLAAA